MASQDNDPDEKRKAQTKIDRKIMTEDGRLSPEGLEGLRNRFQAHSRKAQAYYTIMHTIRDIAGSDDAASAWMDKPLPEFEGKTPAQLVNEGRTEEVFRYINSLKPGSAG